MLNRRTFLQAMAGGERPPNIVLFISDDHGYRDCSLYANTQARTPALEAIARQGLTCTNFIGGSPTCVPSRAVLMSGLMPARNGAEANHSGIAGTVRTLPSYLKEIGYKVAHFGKGHFQPAANYSDWEAVPSEIKGPKGLYDDLNTQAVERWLSAQTTSQPLCLVVGSHSPHVYWDSTEGYDPAALRLPPNLVDTPVTRDFMAAYFSDISKMDRQLGQVYESVRRHLPINTLFLYLTDNGAQWPFAKWTLYDGGIRLPMVLSWPGRIQAQRRCDALIGAADLLPTLIELAGGKAPPGIDGRSFAPVALGKTDRHRDYAFATHSGDGRMNSYPARCIRTRRHKLILNLHPEFLFSTHMDAGIDLDGAAWWRSWVERARTDAAAAQLIRRYREHPAEELYDLEADPYETTNLAGQPAQRALQAGLRRRLDGWMTDQGDQRRVFGTPRLLGQ